jgi:D-alanyl-D-alanine carboxypeptidase (penicillin-binding protein 5/6)
MKKIIIGIFLALSVVSFANNDVRSVARLLGTSDGRVINVVDGDKIHPLASVTKMMTILLTYEAISKGEISMDDMVRIPDETRRVSGSRIWMAIDDQLSVRDLLKATAIYSANNAAYTLAYYIGNGDVEGFVRSMNKKAISLGMKNTKYYTPAGLPPKMTGKKMDISTVNDIYKLSMVLLRNRDYMTIASMKETTIRNGEQKFSNRNKLLGRDGIYGMKTGHHSEAGYNISIVSKKNGLSMVEVVLGASNEKKRDEVVLGDLDEFYTNYKKRTIISEGEEMGVAEIEGGEETMISFYAPKNYNKLLNNNVKIRKEVVMNKGLKAPIAAGTIVGKYRVLLDDQVYLEKDLTIKHSIKKLGFFGRIFN